MASFYSGCGSRALWKEKINVTGGIPLLDWANEVRSAKHQSERILKRNAGKIVIPPAVKVGRYWMVDRNKLLVRLPNRKFRQTPVKITTDYYGDGC